MKRKINRETVIGLSVLAVLLVILGVVVVRRFMRPHIPPELAVALAEEKPIEEPPLHHSKREADSLPKPTLLTPADLPKRDRLQSSEDLGHWNADSKEGRREAPTIAMAPSPIASDPPIISRPQEDARPHRRDEEPRTTYAPSGPALTASDDRYATTAPSTELRKEASSRSMVIQVSSGEQPDAAPRPLDRYPARSFDQPVQPGPAGTPYAGSATADTIPPAPAAGPADGLTPGMPADREAGRRHAEKDRSREFPANGMPVEPEAARRYAEKVRSREFQAAGAAVDPALAAAPPSGPAAPYNYASNGDPASNYSAAPGGYAPENSLRHGDEALGRMRSPVRLRDDGMYEVQPNDSYWTISEKVYGNGGYFRALAEQNRGKAARPDRLPPGLVVSTPPVAQLEKDYPDLCPRPNHRDALRNRGAVSMAATAGGGRTYVVQEGDTLSSIARYELGKVSRWAEIYQLNREALGKDYDYLTPGMRLVLPIRDSSSGDRMTRRADDGVPSLRYAPVREQLPSPVRGRGAGGEGSVDQITDLFLDRHLGLQRAVLSEYVRAALEAADDRVGGAGVLE